MQRMVTHVTTRLDTVWEVSVPPWINSVRASGAKVGALISSNLLIFVMGENSPYPNSFNDVEVYKNSKCT